jgi:hypothetical protein
MWNPGGGQQLWQCTVWRHQLLTSYLGGDPYNMCEVECWCELGAEPASSQAAARGRPSELDFWPMFGSGQLQVGTLLWCTVPYEIVTWEMCGLFSRLV